ncbi:hypothetical protein ACWEJ6_48960 [Nonomuraea sp. NPDC004702]
MAAHLFLKHQIRAHMAMVIRDMTTLLHKWDQEALLRAPEHDVIETLIRFGTLDCPRLLRHEAWMLEPAETIQESTKFGRRIERRVSLLTLVVPYEGERILFFTRPSRYPRDPPSVPYLDDRQLWLTVEGQLTDGAKVRKRFDRQLNEIEQWLGWAREEIDPHNANIRESVPRLVSHRRAELLAIRDVQAAVGFPIRKRTDAAAYSVPVKRRPVRPSAGVSASQGARFAPEPVLAEEDYEAALEVLRHSRDALERTPSLAAGMDEESIRNLLLVSLNAQFEGAASGEVFNGNGKTDILIRERDRNVFIGECKIWAGPKTVQDALNQLLGYLVWRDTRAALLVFIRNKDVSAAIRSAVEAVEAHPNCKRRGRHDSHERVDFVMHARGDRDREIHLALLPFALPGDATSRFRR